jgi:hypothetical protein
MAKRRKETYVVDAEFITETDLAYLFEIDDEEVWIPKSQCEWDEEGGTVEIDMRFAEKKGLC